MFKMKICMIGAFAVGKTSLVQRHVHSLFSSRYHTTVGVKIDKKQVSVRGQPVDLIIWDLHGEDEFQTLRTSYLTGASGFVYVVDGTRRATLEVASKLRERVRQAVGPAPYVVAINKSDLQNAWELGQEDIAALQADGAPVFRTSAKTGAAVDQAFQALAGLIMEP